MKKIKNAILNGLFIIAALFFSGTMSLWLTFTLMDIYEINRTKFLAILFFMIASIIVICYKIAYKAPKS